MKKTAKKGFTLVELMVVIVIIGILAALAIPRFLGASNKSKATEFKPILKQVYTLQEAYKQEKDTYGSTGAQIAFDEPKGGKARFTYSILDGTGANVTVGHAELLEDGLLKKADATDMTVAEGTACANAEAADANNNGVGALAELAAVASVPTYACD